MLQIFNLTSFALALLLVFRTNSSYNRWWEARILWGSQINMTRDIVRRVRLQASRIADFISQSCGPELQGI